MTSEHWIDLTCHPSTRTEAVRAIHALVRRSAAADLRITFRLDGDISQIQVPPPRTPRFTVGLWQHTCFEVFIAPEGHPAYHELNFAPSAEWTVYAFRSRRDGGPLADENLRPNIAVRTTDNHLELDALVRLDSLSATHSDAPLRVGLMAVIEASDGFSYWALRHFSSKPDFHDPDGFALLLNPPGPPR
jgi:hypothetical protein